MHELPPNEIANRQARVREETHALDMDGIALFHAVYVGYVSGFTFVPTERPIAYLAAADGREVLVVPRLEVEHARADGRVERVESYDEFPGPSHPMQLVAELLEELGLAGAGRRLGVDHDGYPPVWGYWGPPLSELVGARLTPIARALDRVMMVKSDYELEMLRLSSRWAVRAHELLQEYTRVGAGETEVSKRASTDATIELARTLPGYRAGQITSGASAGYRGQIGRRGALPHTMGQNLSFQPGDTLVTGATAPMWGYVSELERTMFMGQPGPEQRRLFAHMLALQDLCFEAIRPGTTARAVDRVMREYFEREGLWGHWRHHVGHGIGLRYHEAPFLDRGDDTVLEPGMVLTVEPGLYDDDWGGFRHSDTLAVTTDGVEILTAAYPRDLASLVIPAD